MTRAYDEFLAGIFDRIGPGWVAMLLLAVAVGGGLLWYTYPAWLRFPRLRFSRLRFPRLRFPRLRLPRPKWRWRRPRFKRKRKRRTKKEPKSVKPKPRIRTPEPGRDPRPVAAALSAADRLAAEGRYAEAIRERLRESVTALTRYGVIAPAPAWTAHEVATQASANRPAVSGPLAGATDIFSEVWYGRRPAGPDQDALMRRLTAEVKAALETHR